MITHVVLSNSFTRQLKRLHRVGGMAKVVAKHAEAIIEQWVCGDVKSPRQLTRNTLYGEGRIKDCRKYDLVEAYRLLTVMVEDHLIFLFVGTHDECDQWIRHNTGWEPEGRKRGDRILPVQKAILRTADEDAEPKEDETAEDCLLREINERDLRIIFSGICRSRVNQQRAEPSQNLVRRQGHQGQRLRLFLPSQDR